MGSAGPATLDFSLILAPTDFSDHAARGFGLARRVARHYGARLVVLHVVDDAVPALLPDVAGFRYDDVADSIAERAREELEALARPAREEGLDVDVEIGFGAPDAEICRIAEARGADLIVIATHGRTGALHLLVGSVTEKVIRRCGCPVLVAR